MQSFVRASSFLCFAEPCPDNAEYIECGPACIPSCQAPSSNCTGSCISGCFCKPGFVFKGRRCVPVEKCGCLDENNNYYEVRHSTWNFSMYYIVVEATDNFIASCKCRCNAIGGIQCNLPVLIISSSSSSFVFSLVRL